MKILPLLIASAAILFSCDKKETSSTETSSVAAPMNDSTTVAVENSEAESAPENATAVAANNTSDQPALNPEHGQPYHRCEIPVGAPINSAPSQNPPQVVPQQSANNNFNTAPISPSLAPSPAQAIGPKPANNPAHGEPHHRCDLEVGAPLI